MVLKHETKFIINLAVQVRFSSFKMPARGLSDCMIAPFTGPVAKTSFADFKVRLKNMALRYLFHKAEAGTIWRCSRPAAPLRRFPNKNEQNRGKSGI